MIFFNKHEFLQAFKIMNEKPFEAKKRFEEYLEKYPTDYSTYTYYASILIHLHQTEKAKEVLKHVNTLVSKDYYFMKNTDKVYRYLKSYNLTKLKILMSEQKYQEAHDFCLKMNPKIDMDLSNLIFFLENKLNILPTFNRSTINYLKRQMIDYQEDDFIEHIKKHQADYNIDTDEPNSNIFVPELDIIKVVEEIKKYIQSDKAIFNGLYEDYYFFKYDECGRENNKLVNFFKVICFNDTKNFITMCPIKYGKDLPYVDLNYLKEQEEIKIKKISQVEKFYKRYQKR